MANTWLSCKGCIGSDPTQDTVKIDPNLMFRENPNKENTRPAQQAQKHSSDAEMREREAQEQKLAEERRRQAKYEAEEKLRKEVEAAAAKATAAAEERKRKEEQLVEAAAQAKASAAAAEKKVREAEAAAAARAAAEAAAAAAAEDERLRQEGELAARRERAAVEAAEVAAAQEKVDGWCKANGFQDKNLSKKTLRGATKFPLHTAVKHQNYDMIGMLLKCGANRDARDSKKQTPAELAAKLNRSGSYDQIIAILG